MKFIKLFSLALLLCCGSLSVNAQRPNRGPQTQQDSSFLAITDSLSLYLHPIAQAAGRLDIATLGIDDEKKTLNIEYNAVLSQYPFRDETVAAVYAICQQGLPEKYKAYSLSILSGGKEISEWIPLYYRQAEKAKPAKASKNQEIPLKTNISQAFNPDKGLQNRHIALWQSHGYYYEQKLDRWEWQRARIFLTVEDLYTQSYVLPFLVPMLENAGANVLLPRERDSQTQEVIVDNDMPWTRYTEQMGSQGWTSPADSGFAHIQSFYQQGENPFRMGSYRQIATVATGKRSKETPSYATWQADIPQSGHYAVYISYKSLENSAPDAHYTVFHKGGQTEFKINQSMGGGTWIYLGHFAFDKGLNQNGRVVLNNISSHKDKLITADGVKFGGGMGNIGRNPAPLSEPNRQSALAAQGNAAQAPPTLNEYPPMLSHYPRFTEGARYWLQWAGAPDSVYSPNQGRNDYNDDYMSRGLWVNYLSGGSKANSKNPGLKIPVDLSLAFHTDAGTTLTDSIVGSLIIYTSRSNESELMGDGRSRFISRDLADLIQTQIVSDVREQFEPQWMRRGIWDRSYSESRSPEVPAVLLELLSHQNLADMRYGLDPAFRFTVSRAIYKGMLKFLATQNQTTYVVQPLPVSHFSVGFDAQGQNALLHWQPVTDSLEPTAQASSYVLYTRVDEGDFDNGILVKDTQIRIPLEAGRTYSFKVAAANEGGISFPSEILSIHRAIQEKGRVLIVNGFDRISAPASFASRDSLFGGFQDAIDFGVPYLNDISFIGSQYEFRRHIPWMDDDAPGFGASYSTYETQVLAGNTFDFPIVHGRAFASQGYSYASVSRDAWMQDSSLSVGYQIVDLIMGKQKQTQQVSERYGTRYTVFPKTLQERITAYCQGGGKLLLSGANIASDLWDAPNTDPASQAFAQNVLKYKWMVGQATQGNQIKACPSPYMMTFLGEYSFYHRPNSRQYWVEAPDALVPATPSAHTIFRYADNNLSAGVAYKGADYSVVSLGFPIECLDSPELIKSVVYKILQFFGN